MLSRIFIVLALFVAAAVPVQARIGESQGQIEMRFGVPKRGYAPIPPATLAQVHKRKGYSVLVGYLKGKAAYIDIQRIDRKPMSRQEFNAILEANAGDSFWARNMGAKGFLLWTRGDGKVIAAYDPAQNRMLLQSAEFFKLARKASAGAR